MCMTAPASSLPVWFSLMCLLVAGCGASGSNKPTKDLLPVGSTSVVVNIDDGIVGTLVRPGGRGPHPAVLMLHGFGSKRDEVNDMFKRTAEGLAEQGIASLRIDFRGCGDSAGKFRETTIDSQIADAERALSWLRAQGDIDKDLLGLHGFSLGAAIAILTTSRHPDEIKSLSVWAPTADLKGDFVASLGQEMFDRAMRQGSASQDLGWRKVTLDKGFFVSLDKWDVDGALLAFEGPFLAVAGARDPLKEHALTLAQSVDRMAVVVRDADHIFHDTVEDKSRADTAIQATVVHFTGTLKWKEDDDESADE